MKSEMMRKVCPQDLKEGVRFSSPVFFDDGQNLFLAEHKPLKKYQLAALSRWSIPYVLTCGREFTPEECKLIETREKELTIQNAAGIKTSAELIRDNNPEEISELEEVEEVEELEEV